MTVLLIVNRGYRFDLQIFLKYRLKKKKKTFSSKLKYMKKENNKNNSGDWWITSMSLMCST